MPPAFSNKNIVLTMNHSAGGLYSATTNDDQGRSTTINTAVPQGTPSSCEVKVTGFGNLIDCSGVNASWPGTRPWSSGSAFMAPTSGITGNGSFSLILPM